MDETWKNHILTDFSSLKGKRVLIRVDWNLTIENGVPTDTSRADVTFEFLRKLSFAGAKIVLMTHLGEKGESLDPIVPYIKNHVPFIAFNPSMSFDELEHASRAIKEGEGMLLQNVRMWPGETENLPSLARSFASLGDIFINNAFSVSHREHASVVGVSKYLLSYFGPLFARELEHLTDALQPEKPALFIIGGAKIKTKLSLIGKYLDQGVHVFVGGAMVHDIWKARGIEIGVSLFDGTVSLGERFIRHPMLLTPTDVVLDTGETVAFDKIPKNGNIVDCGEETLSMVTQLIDTSKTVIANGPVGMYEKGWLKGSEGILNHMAHSQAITYIGGGDTVAVAHSLQLLKKFNFVSLGGGAMLDFLASGTLPGIHAVTESQRAGYR